MRLTDASWTAGRKEARCTSSLDFVCGPRGRVDAVEVADWATLDRRKATAPGRALPGRPSVVASRDELEFGNSANLVPAALLLWAVSGPK